MVTAGATPSWAMVRVCAALVPGAPATSCAFAVSVTVVPSSAGVVGTVTENARVADVEFAGGGPARSTTRTLSVVEPAAALAGTVSGLAGSVAVSGNGYESVAVSSAGDSVEVT